GECERVQQEPRGADEAEDDGRRAGGLDLRDVLEIARVVSILRALRMFGVEEPREAERHGLRVERRPVMERHAAPELERGGEPVLRKAPLRREARLKLAVRVERDERLVEGGDDLEVLAPLRLGGIERGGIGAPRPDERALRGGLFPSARRGEGERDQDKARSHEGYYLPPPRERRSIISQSQESGRS